ncbi:hypothetical protein GCM10020366_64740 [Saccharopolyspora gregorii]|uniref:Uncharacterized protein n=1 Tax=Saccharopolyspora gregorii TaxID=33914 RepID=A0ABP6S149_9PSEU
MIHREGLLPSQGAGPRWFSGSCRGADPETTPRFGLASGVCHPVWVARSERPVSRVFITCQWKSRPLRHEKPRALEFRSRTGFGRAWALRRESSRVAVRQGAKN